MATTMAMPDHKVKEVEIQIVAPTTGGVSLVLAMMVLTAVASSWAAIIVGMHFLELHVLGN